MPGATHVPLTVAQKSRRRVFYVGRPFGHYCPLKYAGAAQAQSPGEKGGRARLSGGRAPAGMPRAGAPLAFPHLFRGATTISDIEGKLDVLRVERTTARARAAITSIS
jgi:hypothetical protein